MSDVTPASGSTAMPRRLLISTYRYSPIAMLMSSIARRATIRRAERGKC